MGSKILILLLFFSSLSISKNEGNIWYFGGNCGLDFNNADVRVINGSKLNSKEACATFCDEKGEVILYSDGVSIWNKNHKKINDNQLVKGNQSSTQGVLILPSGFYNIGKQYIHIYTTINLGFQNGLNKYTIEFDYNYPDSSKIIASENIALNTSEKLSAFPIINQYGYKDYLIAFQSTYVNNYKIGFYYNKSVKYIDISGSNLYSKVKDNTIGYLRFSPDGKKLACVIPLDSTIELYDFDKENISLSNRIDIPIGENKFCYGLEFYGSNYLLYTINALNSEINVLDIKSNTKTNIISYERANMFGAITIAPDSNLYVALPDTDSILQISAIKEKDNYSFKINKYIKLSSIGNIGLPNQLPNQQRDLNCQNLVYTNTNFNSIDTNKLIGDTKSINQDKSYLKLNSLKRNTLGGIKFGDINDINSGFEINCKFRIYNGDNNGNNDGSIPGADGIAFAITSQEFDTTKYKAGYLGYEGVKECLAIEYDTYKNGPFADLNGNHISVMSNGLNAISTRHNSNILEKTNSKVDIITSDSTIYSTKIIYQNNNLKVYFNKGFEAIKEAISIENINLKSLLGLDNTKKLHYTLFGATGLAWEEHEIVQLSLCQLINDSLEIQNSIETNSYTSSDNIKLDINPNPIENDAIISISNCNIQNAEINIFDLLGHKIKTIFNGEIEDFKQIQFNSNFLSRGIYYIEVKTETNKKISKLIIK